MAGRRTTIKYESYAKIEGLDHFLKNMGVLPSQMQRAESVFQTLAAATVYTEARELATETGQQQAKYAQTLRQVGNGAVSYGGEPGAMGAEFGSYLYGQFPEWRGNRDDAGYFFWPAIRHFRDEDMIDLWVHQVWEVVQDLFSR